MYGILREKQTICGLNGSITSTSSGRSGGNIGLQLIVVCIGKECALKEFSPEYVENGWLTAAGKYTIQSRYQWKRGAGEHWPRWRGVWNNVNVPKHSFICWVMMHKRLLIQARLACLVCVKRIHVSYAEAKPETREHMSQCILKKYRTCGGDVQERPECPYPYKSTEADKDGC
ncbi:hypothetical protein KY290_005481 [Solanum tuberosum]|uniref:Reverse transcriptase zinc-binding domain-containing protein n=1 Tax=Solanum tuberosum TaxID=4113 RepID=A0ABQ7WG53_SOLTU|nr:hypothetical protein KY289_005872 [Solanum tuberosum]KAH0779054.1 hypothetical protein KY290_005481 [Solanum tuberosum]